MGGDKTYLPARDANLDLTTVLDLASLRGVGWPMQDSMDVTLVLCAFRMAITTRQPAPGLIQHSDRDSQYASEEYRAELAAHGMLASMSRKDRGCVVVEWVTTIVVLSQSHSR